MTTFIPTIPINPNTYNTIDPKQAKKVSRLRDRVNTKNATQNNLKEYIVTKIYLHNYKNFIDFSFWTVFKEEFKNFTVTDFKRLHVSTRFKLCTYLLRQGVYVEKNNKKHYISNVLFFLLQEEE